MQVHTPYSNSPRSFPKIPSLTAPIDNDGDWNKADEKDFEKAGRTKQDPWSPEPATTPLHHHAAKEEGQGGAN